MCKVTQFFNSKKVGVMLSMMCFSCFIIYGYCKNGGEGDIFLLFLKLF